MVKIDGNQRRVVAGKNAVQGAVCRRLHDLVDFLVRGITDCLEGQVYQRHVDGRHPYGVTIQFAVQFRQDQADGRRRAGLRRNHGHGGGTGAPQVGVIHVRKHLIIGVGMDGGHDAVYHPDVVMQHLDDRGQAVGRTRGVGDHAVRFFQDVMIDAVDDGCIHVFAAGRGDNDFFGPSLQVGAGFFLAGEETGGLMYDVHAQFAPGQPGRVPFRQDPYPVVVDQHVFAVNRYRTGKLAVGAVEAGQVGIGFGIAKVVDRNDADFVGAAALVQRPQNISADPAVAVDSYVYSHYV